MRHRDCLGFLEILEVLEFDWGGGVVLGREERIGLDFEGRKRHGGGGPTDMGQEVKGQGLS